MSCTGVLDEQSAQFIVQSGEAVAAVTANVTQPSAALAFDDTERVVPLSDVDVVAGDKNLPPITEIVERDTGTLDELPVGDGYLLLIGQETLDKPRYFLSLGVEGSFIVRGDTAYERCPNYDDPSQSKLAAQGIAVDQLIANLRSAFQIVYQTASPTTSSPQSPTSSLPANSTPPIAPVRSTNS